MGEHELRRAAQAQADAVVAFCQRLIRTPGLPGAEGAVAALVRAEMESLGYDDVWTDEAGNVVGCVRGAGGASLMLNTHLDHVAAGNPDRWPVPPFGGEVKDGAVWGRGAMDIKGPLACQVHAPAVLRRAGIPPAGDVYVTAVVMEEVGGVGARVLLERLRPDLAVVGEATSCDVARGHRGRVELQVRFVGRSAHASAPERAANPHYAAARFLTALRDLEMVASLTFGPATVAPTLVASDQSSANVTPGELLLTLDWRTVPEEGPDAVLARVAELAAAAAGEGVAADARVRSSAWETYTGLVAETPSIHGAFVLERDHPLVEGAVAAIEGAFGASVGTRLWRFATDGGHFMDAGVPTIGFAPGDETLAHTHEERIGLDELAQGLLGNAALCAHLGEVRL